jgi:fatty-acyl-CoA synthase
MVEGSYASGTSTFPLRGMPIGKMLNNIAAKYPENEALVSVHQNIRWTYREFLENVNRVAREDTIRILDIEEKAKIETAYIF